MESVAIKVFKHDVPELLNNEYNNYNNDGGLEFRLDNIVISEDDRTYLQKTKKVKSSLGTIKRENGVSIFIRD